MHHVRNARETGSAGGLVLDAYPGSDVGQGGEYGGEIELLGLVLGESEQGEACRSAIWAPNRGGIQAVAAAAADGFDRGDR